jgi:outer membrane lipoprotein-sorting protein
MEISVGGHQVTTLMDPVKLETTLLMPERNMYMVMPLKQPTERQLAKQERHAVNLDVNTTGKTDTILGYKADQIVVTDKEKGTTTEMWVAEGLGTFMGMGSGGASPFAARQNPAAAAKWEEALQGKDGFPLRVVSHDAKGKETFKMEATKIEPGPLPESLFVPPAGYQKFEMPNFGGMNPFKHE